MKLHYKTLTVISSLFIFNCNAEETAQVIEKKAENPTKTSVEAKWHNLLEGDNLDQWRAWRRKEILQPSAWTVTNGVLHLDKTEGSKKVGGSLITLKQYPNFEFKFESALAGSKLLLAVAASVFALFSIAAPAVSKCMIANVPNKIAIVSIPLIIKKSTAPRRST